MDDLVYGGRRYSWPMLRDVTGLTDQQLLWALDRQRESVYLALEMVRRWTI